MNWAELGWAVGPGDLDGQVGRGYRVIGVIMVIQIVQVVQEVQVVRVVRMISLDDMHS